MTLQAMRKNGQFLQTEHEHDDVLDERKNRGDERDLEH
jgi:hypothetical protein